MVSNFYLTNSKKQVSAEMIFPEILRNLKFQQNWEFILVPTAFIVDFFPAKHVLPDKTMTRSLLIKSQFSQKNSKFHRVRDQLGVGT